MSISGQRVARFKWLERVLSEHGPVAPSARLVACALFNHMQREGTGATASERTLASETGLARSTVQTALNGLEASGWLLRREHGRGRFGQPVYVNEATIPNNSNDEAHGPTIGPIDPVSNGPAGGPIAQRGNGPIESAHWTDSPPSLDRQSVINRLTLKKPVMDAPRPEPRSYDKEASEARRARLIAAHIGNGYPQDVAERLAKAQLVVESDQRGRRHEGTGAAI